MKEPSKLSEIIADRCRCCCVTVPLKPCPFCGGAAFPYMNTPSCDMEPWVHVVCLDCGAGAPSVEKWNQRKD